MIDERMKKLYGIIEEKGVDYVLKTLEKAEPKEPVCVYEDEPMCPYCRTILDGYEEQEMWEFFNAINNTKNIADHYGLKHQLSKCKEELYELYGAINDYQEDDSKENLKAIMTEIADVEIMTSQLKYLLNLNLKVDNEKLYKINRQLKRMESEE